MQAMLPCLDNILLIHLLQSLGYYMLVTHSMQYCDLIRDCVSFVYFLLRLQLYEGHFRLHL